MKKVLIGLSIAACGAMAFDSFELGKIEVAAKQENSGMASDTIDVAKTTEDTDKKRLSEVLNDVSGVNVQNVGGRNEQEVMLRGFDSKHVPLYIDGIPIAVPYDGYVDFSRFLISDLSEIEVSKGFASPLLGANTFAGAINMVTKKPKKALEVEFDTGFFGKNGWSSDLNLGTNQDLYYAQLAMSKTKREWSELSGAYNPVAYNSGTGVVQDKGKRVNSASNDAKVNFKFGITPNSTDEYSFNYIKQWADKGVPPYANANIAGVSSTQIKYWGWDYWDKESYYFISKTAFGDGHYVKTRAFYDIFKNSLLIYTSSSYSTLASGTSSPSHYDDDTKGASVELFFNLHHNNSIAFASHYKEDTHKEHVNGYPTYEMQDEIYSNGIEYKHKLFGNTNIKLGTSYDMEKVKQADDSNYNGTTVPNKEMSHGSAYTLNPVGSIETAINDNTTLFGGVGQKSRIPSIKDRYSYRFATYIANPDLKAEKTTNYEVGVKHRFGSQTIKTNVFYMNIEDYIQTVSNVSGTKSQFQNVGNVVSKGVEVDYSAIPFESLSINANATFQSVTNENPNVKITDIPNAMANLSVRYEPAKWFRWTNSVRAESGRYSDAAGATRTDPFAVFNTAFGFTINKYTSVETGVDNLFDKNYAISYGYPEEGRKLWANLKLKY